LPHEFLLYGPKPPDVDPDEFESWILFEDDDLLVIDKPGWLVCHPSKRGPLSSLIGAARSHLETDRLHLVARLDRETSGVVILAKNPEAARKYQMAIESRRVRKIYFAVLTGELASSARVDLSIGKCTTSPVYSKMRVLAEGDAKDAVTTFTPIESSSGYTTCRIEIETGRRHQIRVHAEWLGHAVAGDKLYGPDEQLFLEFIEQGWTERHAVSLPIQRQALHCLQYTFDFDGESQVFTAPVADDIRSLCCDKLGFSALTAN